ncbi:hypothetical protein [Paracraurococcus ruber]|uniref:Transcriptional regulator n=1 Tax=Paracraurococcus ruber TaxID=77675 RepID=A0ABS1D6W6_9PROT|nr:hypothetical protein [Paracraurococcus ruber]MBK1662473.1 hypothetical protein [Paracraurococcus ruber]TDG17063.1 hypothetical protein E2C05_28800 [Paracraurococcus ruber]
MAISQELEGRGFTTPAAGVEMLGLKPKVAHSLLIARQRREDDVTLQLMAAALADASPDSSHQSASI